MKKSGSLTSQLNDVLDDYYQVVRDEFEGAAKDVAEECVERLRAVPWKTNTGKNYSKNWTYKRQRWGSYVVYNKKTYRLTHLLENGHDSANQYGEGYKRVKGTPHIYPVYKWAVETLEHEMQMRAERG